MVLNVGLLRNNIFIKYVAEMRMLSWISWNTQKDRIWNEEICLKIWVAPIDEKIRENCFRWFGHVQRRAVNALVRVSWSKLSELKNVEEDPI